MVYVPAGNFQMGDNLDSDPSALPSVSTSQGLVPFAGDGAGDYAELIAGTNPTNPASRLAITGIVRNADGSVTLRWSGVAGRTYRVLRSATPGFASYEVVASGWPGLSPTTIFTDVGAGTVNARTFFYKVSVE